MSETPPLQQQHLACQRYRTAATTSANVLETPPLQQQHLSCQRHHNKATMSRISETLAHGSKTLNLRDAGTQHTATVPRLSQTPLHQQQYLTCQRHHLRSSNTSHVIDITTQQQIQRHRNAATTPRTSEAPLQQKQLSDKRHRCSNNTSPIRDTSVATTPSRLETPL